MANGRRSKNFIPHLRHNDELITEQERKGEIFTEACEQLLGHASAREADLDLNFLDMEAHDLSDLEIIFSEEEVWNTIKELPLDRASWPDGFVAAFYQRVWPTIKNDVMAMVMKLYVEDGRGFGKLNRAHIVLIPKKSDAEEVGDFRPISLTHSAAKLFAKMLANRVRRKMREIVAANQSAFICGRHLRDNFLLVRKVARKIHAHKETGVFLKLDISRAFDSIAWPFPFEVLRSKGFGQKWLSWISILLRTASTKVIVNGIPGRSFVHVQGLRQGDPISPLLFVIAMDVLLRIMVKAADLGVVVSSFTGFTAVQSVSIYADDVALFVRPTEVDLRFVTMALKAFGDASGLRVNYHKSSVVLIHGDELDKNRVENLLQCNLGEFPCKYLGL